MLKYILRRFLFSLIALIVITIAVFLIIHLIPGDPAEIMVGPGVEHSEEVEELIRANLGLDKPLYMQYLKYMAGLIRGDMGLSLWTRQPVRSEILRRAGATFELALLAVLFSTFIAIPVGMVSASKPYSAADYTSMAGSFIGVSMPVFWIGILLMLVFSLEIPIFPALGRGEPFFPSLVLMFRGNFSPLFDSLRHLILPAITLGLHHAALVARMTRSSMLEVLNQDYIRTARSKGFSEFVVIYKHAFRNALIPIITVVGMQFGFLLGGSVITETVFAWPGLGRFIIESILARDYPFIQGGLLFFAIVILVVNLVTDLLYGLIDPRVRYQ